MEAIVYVAHSGERFLGRVYVARGVPAGVVVKRALAYAWPTEQEARDALRSAIEAQQITGDGWGICAMRLEPSTALLVHATIGDLYHASIAADEAFAEAVRKAHGPKATRWDPGVDAHPDVALALRHKAEAFEAWARGVVASC